MEAMRILNALQVHPRRTIRIALWSGEEELLYGSMSYVEQHFATFNTSNTPETKELPEFLQPMNTPPTLKPEASKLDSYYNLDTGTGKILGIYAEGNEGIGAIFAQWIEPIKDLGVTTISERNSVLQTTLLSIELACPVSIHPRPS